MEGGGVNPPGEGAKSNVDTRPGCGCGESITVQVTPTTGGQFDLQVSKTESVENLKKLISKKLKVPKERICLLHRDRQLRDGTVQDNQLVDGSRLTLLPSVETGLLAQRPEQSVMQALESLNDSQVNDFLSGKAPLNLTMRLGDHMMLIQLQLSTVTPTGSRRSTSSSSSTSPSSPSSRPPPSPSKAQTSSVSTATTTTTTTSPSAASATPTSTATSTSSVSSSTAPSDSASSSTSTSTASSPTSTASSSTSTASSSTSTSSASSSSSSTTSSPSSCRCDPLKPTLDTRALAEASRNLTQTLKQLSSEVLTSRSDTAEESASSRRRQGAIIESMHHHGKGVYSGTFSGTLNPALQDKFGRPKRDISTIIHILNDLLCATPQYRRHARQGHTITLEATSGSPVKATVADKAAANLEIIGEESVQLSRENQATRGKMEQLRLIMEERRARRRARREARVAPYTQWSAKSETAAAVQSTSVPRDKSTESPMETDSSPDLCELNPEPVVA